MIVWATVPPWVSNVATEDGRAVGGGAFGGAPSDGVVEMAHFALAECPGRGYATQTAAQRVSIAKQALPDNAFTPMEVTPSTRILERLGFNIFGIAHDAGNVWEWRMPIPTKETNSSD
jgi:[ribosomal protein S5]-alanine N-acetyltransferase